MIAVIGMPLIQPPAGYSPLRLWCSARLPSAVVPIAVPKNRQVCDSDTLGGQHTRCNNSNSNSRCHGRPPSVGYFRLGPKSKPHKDMCDTSTRDGGGKPWEAHFMDLEWERRWITGQGRGVLRNADVNNTMDTFRPHSFSVLRGIHHSHPAPEPPPPGSTVYMASLLITHVASKLEITCHLFL